MDLIRGDFTLPSSLSGRSTIGLPREALKESRQQLTVVVLGVIAVGAAISFGWSAAAVLGWAEWDKVWALPTVGLSMSVASLGVLAACKSERLSDRAILGVALTYEVAICGLAAFAHSAFEYSRYGHVTGFGPYVIMILFMPLVVAARPRTILIASVASSAAVPAALYVAALAGIVQVPAKTYVELAMAPLAYSALAYVASRYMTRVRTEVAKARRMGSYVLEERLGAGGMGEVWRARHWMLARPAAIKLVQESYLGGTNAERREEALVRFYREAKATAALESPHTVRLYDFGVTDDRTFYYVMELLDGIDLETLVRTGGPQPAERVSWILLQVCDSLADAHAAGLVHRDIKPANIMVCRCGYSHDFVKVLDFGLVALQPHVSESEEKLTRANTVVGTPGFMAPEMLLGSKTDHLTDIYSVGCVAYWLLTGKVVFAGSSAMEIAAAHLRDAVKRPSELGVSLSRDLEDVVLSCLAKEPEDRPQSAEMLAGRLEACVLPAQWDNHRARQWWQDNAAPRRSMPPSLSAEDSPFAATALTPRVK